jgi:3-methyladenine DNA glycosylase AlkD
MIPSKWNKESYNNFVDYLISQKDDKYKEFQSKLCPSCKYEILGIKIPVLRKIAKEISKTDFQEFLKFSNDVYYEEVMLQGLVISHIKDEKIFYNYFKKYIIKIDNWAICDTFCNSIKIVSKYEEKYFEEAKKLSISSEEFASRVGLIMILNYFIKEENIESIFDILNQIKSDKYYINMAEAWLICEIYTKYPDKTLNFLTHNTLNKCTLNKSISKLHDSYRVPQKEKLFLNTLRRK